MGHLQHLPQDLHAEAIACLKAIKVAVDVGMNRDNGSLLTIVLSVVANSLNCACMLNKQVGSRNKTARVKVK
jgi:hypothetical protein